MDKETVKRLAEQNGWYDCYEFPEAELLAFAQACCDWQKEKDAQICLRERVDALATGEDTDKSYNRALEDAADTIRNAKESPESDIEIERITT